MTGLCMRVNSKEIIMKLTNYLFICIIICILFSSCTSVYIDPSKSQTTDISSNTDPNKEYFTTGNVYSRNDLDNGFVYEVIGFIARMDPK